MDPSTTVIDGIQKLAPLGTNVLLMIAVAALWKKVNNGYFTALSDVKDSLSKEIDGLRQELGATRSWLFDLLRDHGVERRGHTIPPGANNP